MQYVFLQILWELRMTGIECSLKVSISCLTTIFLPLFLHENKHVEKGIRVRKQCTRKEGKTGELERFVKNHAHVVFVLARLFSLICILYWKFATMLQEIHQTRDRPQRQSSAPSNRNLEVELIIPRNTGRSYDHNISFSVT